MSRHVFSSPLDVDACRSAIQQAACRETFSIDAGMAETPVFRVRNGNLHLRFKRAMVRVFVHNWFVMRLSALPGGGTKIEADENRGLGRGWWTPGISAGLFVGIIMGLNGDIWQGGIVFATLGTEALGFAFSAVVTAIIARGDRERLASLVGRVAQAKQESGT